MSHAAEVPRQVLSGGKVHPPGFTNATIYTIRMGRTHRDSSMLSVPTAYVGCDKYGWGVIGTQALWCANFSMHGTTGTFKGDQLALQGYWRQLWIVHLPLSCLLIKQSRHHTFRSCGVEGSLFDGADATPPLESKKLW